MELKKISDLCWKSSPNIFFLSILLGIGTGLCYSIIVPFIIYAANADRVGSLRLDSPAYNFFESPTSEMAKMFLYACLSILLVKSISYIMSVYVARKATIQLRIDLYKKINQLPYIDLERIGHAKLINLLNDDVPKIANAAMHLPLIWISIVTIVGTLGYLLYLNEKVFIFVIFALVIAIFTYMLPIQIAARYFGRAREHQDRLQAGINGLVYGAKELKLNEDKSHRYIKEELEEVEQKEFGQSFTGQAFLTVAETYGETISFLVIGIAVFHLPYIYNITTLELFGIVMALLYLTAPVGVILKSMESIQKGKVALHKLAEFTNDLKKEELANAKSVSDNWSTISLDGIGFVYGSGNNNFALRNISFVINRGEITFIVGGNGSGKSTLSKILSLHYSPVQGQIRIGESLIGKDNVASFRQIISAIYSDFYVFPKIYGEWELAQLNKYLADLELSGVVKIKDNRFSTTSLSDGQRRRLALLSLLLEDRPICLFDEWAADQDPRFKKIFYGQILPALKLQNKAVIVISHDDTYFEVSDQMVIMDAGRVKKITRSNHLIEKKILVSEL